MGHGNDIDQKQTNKICILLLSDLKMGLKITKKVWHNIWTVPLGDTVYDMFLFKNVILLTATYITIYNFINCH